MWRKPGDYVQNHPPVQKWGVGMRGMRGDQVNQQMSNMTFSELPIGQDFHFPNSSLYSYHKISSTQALLNSPYSWHIADIKPTSQVCLAKYNAPTSCPIWEKRFMNHIEELEEEYGFFEY